MPSAPGNKLGNFWSAHRGHWLTEATGVTLIASALTALMNLPMLRSLSTAVPHDTGDPLYFSWQLSWVGHALTTDPGALYHPPVFLGATDNLAYTDVVIGYTPLSWILGSGHAGALRLINVAVLVSIAVSFIGGHALARALGARLPGALVAGAGFAFAPWRLEQITHVNVISTGVAALALATLCRGHGWSLRSGWQPERMHAGWIVTGWLLACLQLTYGFATGVMFGYAVGLTVGAFIVGWLYVSWRASAPARLSRAELKPLVLAEVGGAIAFAATGLFFARPYFWVVDHFPEARRGPEWLFLSPPWRGLLTAPETSVWWGARQQSWRQGLVWVPEMVLLPGFVLIGLAVLGLFVSSWPLRRRLWLLAGLAVLTVLAMGIRFADGGRYTFLPLYDHLPGWDALRTPGRLIIWITLGLGLLAAGAVSRLTELAVDGLRRLRARGTDQWWGRNRALAAGVAVATAVALTVPAAVVTMEGRGRVPMLTVDFPTVDLNKLPQPVLVLPFDVIRDYQVMTWQADGWPLLANGSSSFDPAYQAQLRVATAGFPSASSIAAVRARGIATVVLVPGWAPGTPWSNAANLPVDGLGITRSQVGDAVVFDTR